MSKAFITAGVILIIVGTGMNLLGKVPGIGRLPGDLFIKKENFSFYFPITTCLLLSLLISLFFTLWKK